MNNAQIASLVRLFLIFLYAFLFWVTGHEYAKYNDILFILGMAEFGVASFPFYKKS